MQTATYRYASSNGWDQPPDAALDSPETLILVFGPTDLGALATVLDVLRASFPNSVWGGASTAGEIAGRSIDDNTLTVALVRFASTRLRSITHRFEQTAQSFAAGQEIAQSLNTDGLRGILVFADGLNVNGSELARGFSSALPAGIVVTGGLAGDGNRFHQTWVLGDSGPQDHAIVAIGFYGEKIGLAHGSGSGWDILGVDRKVTRASGNVLYELDHQPALPLYKKYLGDRAAELPASALLFPLAIHSDGKRDEETVRTILGIDEAQQSITFAGDIPEGATVQLMRANFERVIDGAAQAAERTGMSACAGGPLLALAISCVGRRLVLSERCEEELDAVLDTLPAQTSMVGFYSYGELSPLSGSCCDLHNQTMTLTLLWENAA